jgi:adenine-specific DNA-methyltransferase
LNPEAGLAPAGRDVTGLGQVFSPPPVVEAMLALRKNHGTVLEPAAGDGAFSRRIPGCTAIELDARFAPEGALVRDFFAYPDRHKFETIVGNPPYVRYQDIAPSTRERLGVATLDQRANLYLYFIEKCLRHLEDGGEMIFVTPRDFLKSTSATRLNARLFSLGTITHAIELGDARVFDGAVPNCLVWRFEKGDLSRQSQLAKISARRRLEESLTDLDWQPCRFVEENGHLAFARDDYPMKLSDVAFVKVGAVSGADEVFADPSIEAAFNAEFVCSETVSTGRTRRMLWCAPGEGSRGLRPPLVLLPHKDRLIERKVRPFDASNWWEWGRADFDSSAPRVYVNGKTRQERPFFTHPCARYDGAVLAVFPRHAGVDIEAFCLALNRVNWGDLGFVCDGRHLFAQRSLEHAPLPQDFAAFLP